MLCRITWISLLVTLIIARWSGGGRGKEKWRYAIIFLFMAVGKERGGYKGRVCGKKRERKRARRG